MICGLELVKSSLTLASVGFDVYFILACGLFMNAVHENEDNGSHDNVNPDDKLLS